MYQARLSNVVIPSEAIVAPDVDEAMWQLFAAVSDFWKLGDDPEPYRLRLRAFMANRIRINPIYRDFYVIAKGVIEGLAAQTRSGGVRAIVHPKGGDRPPRSSPDTAGIRSTICSERVHRATTSIGQLQDIWCD